MAEAQRWSEASSEGTESLVVHNPKPQLTEREARDGWIVEPVGPRGWGKFFRSERLTPALTGK